MNNVIELVLVGFPPYGCDPLIRNLREIIAGIFGELLVLEDAPTIFDCDAQMKGLALFLVPGDQTILKQREQFTEAMGRLLGISGTEVRVRFCNS